MKKLAFMFITLVAILSVSACRIEKVDNSNQPRKSYVLNLRDFQSIKNYSNCDIHFTQSDTYKVTLKATPAWYDHHSVSVENGALTIKSDKYKNQKGVTVLFVNDNQGAEMWISAPSLDEVSLSGSGDLTFDNAYKGKSLSIIRTGSGDTNTKNVSLTGDFKYSVSGSGDADMGSVKAKNASFSVFGSGDVKSGLADVANTELTISGSGDADLNFSNCGNADVSVTGSGDVTLSGELQTLGKHVSGSGDVDTSRLRLEK